jgi:P-type E1-E2 ATPase
MVLFCSVSPDDGSPRPEAITAIADCLQAGIRVKMITGDHPQTAMSIGQMLGLVTPQALSPDVSWRRWTIVS